MPLNMIEQEFLLSINIIFFTLQSVKCSKYNAGNYLIIATVSYLKHRQSKEYPQKCKKKLNKGGGCGVWENMKGTGGK